jgi:thiol-disulfide isomerase/thioredoxin
MSQPKEAAILRIALVALAGIFVLAYVEMSKHPGELARRRSFLDRSMGNACPSNPGERGDFGVADYNWQLTSLDGRTLSFSEFQNKVVFLNVWATWCGPCVAEMPAIQRLHDAVSADGIALVLVSDEDAAEVRDFVRAGNFTFPVYLSKALPAVFESEGIPATFVVSREGRVVLSHLGAAAWDSAACQSFLRALQSPSATAAAGQGEVRLTFTRSAGR